MFPPKLDYKLYKDRAMSVLLITGRQVQCPAHKTSGNISKLKWSNNRTTNVQGLEKISSVHQRFY